MGTAVCQKRTTDLRLHLVVLRGERDSDASEPGVMHDTSPNKAHGGLRAVHARGRKGSVGSKPSLAYE